MLVKTCRRAIVLTLLDLFKPMKIFSRYKAIKPTFEPIKNREKVIPRQLTLHEI